MLAADADTLLLRHTAAMMPLLLLLFFAAGHIDAAPLMPHAARIRQRHYGALARAESARARRARAQPAIPTIRHTLMPLALRFAVFALPRCQLEAAPALCRHGYVIIH